MSIYIYLSIHPSISPSSVKIPALYFITTLIFPKSYESYDLCYVSKFLSKENWIEFLDLRYLDCLSQVNTIHTC